MDLATPTDRYREVSYSYMLRRVRRFRPASLIPAVAALSAEHVLPQSWIENRFETLITPWALARIAEMSLLVGKDHGDSVDLANLLDMTADYLNVTDPEPIRVADIMIRMAFEQFPYRLDWMNEFSRPVAIFEQTPCEVKLRVLNGDWAKDLLGCTVREYAGTAFFVWAAAQANRGQFSRRWLSQGNVRDILKEGVGEDEIRAVLDRQFVVDRDEARRRQRPLPPTLHPDLRRFSFNVLESRPVVEGIGDHELVPVPGLLVKKVSPMGIYYSAMERSGFSSDFATDLGHLFEQYVGRQLNSLTDVAVHPEIIYGRRKGEKGVDWIVEFDEVTLLVEAKSRRPTESVRLMTGDAVDDLVRLLGEGFRQIDRTADLIKEGHLAFSKFSRTRPILGIIVTAEPFFVASGPDLCHVLPASETTVEICSSADLEKLVTVKDESLGSVLVDVMGRSDAVHHSLLQAVSQSGRRFGQNPIIRRAWNSLPWIDRSHVHRSLEVSETGAFN